MKKLRICSFKVESSKVESISRSEDAEDNLIMSSKLFEDEDETDDWYK